jgi:phosphocarrier protein
MRPTDGPSSDPSPGEDRPSNTANDPQFLEPHSPFGGFGLAGEPECVAEAEIVNRLGLHGRAAARLVAAIESFDCEIFVEKGPFRADAKSILDLLSLCCSKATRIRVGANGPEAAEAVRAAVRVIADGFGEEE